MSWLKHECVQQLLDNSPEVFQNASEVLLKLANNVLNNPENPKYRSIRIGNATVTSKLLSANGGIDCLFAMGFQEDGEFLRLPDNALLDDMTSVRNEIVDARKRHPGNNDRQAGPPTAVTSPASSQSAAASSAAVLPPPVAAVNTQTLIRSEANFYSRLTTTCEHVLIYEDAVLQAQARDNIPLERLRGDAKAKLERLDTVQGDKPSFEDFLLLELLAWFKLEFFKWVDAPACEFCGSATSNVGMAAPTADDLRWGANRVENYRCNSCGKHTLFPRYNHPGKLLQTRRGRCGEWANCFTLCCCAVGFEARYILDWTDHVWTEVYSSHQKRWLHCDPCENTCDKPLVYEAGWGKKLSYIIAFSRDDVQDVTWRYSAKHSEVSSRRTECREMWLVNTILKLRKQKWDQLPQARRKTLQLRLITELVEFISPKVAGEGETDGRQSGSLAWRMARGEVGPSTDSAQNKVSICLKDKEKCERMLHLVYSCASDRYIRPVCNEESREWWSLVHEQQNMHRKVEHDWKMVYLARSPGTDSGKIAWKFDFSGSGLLVDTVTLSFQSELFQSGKVYLLLCSDEQCVPINSGSLNTVKDLRGCCSFTLSAEVRGGDGENAWQHAQLFRQKESDVSQYPLDIKITLIEK